MSRLPADKDRVAAALVRRLQSRRSDDREGPSTPQEQRVEGGRVGAAPGAPRTFRTPRGGGRVPFRIADAARAACGAARCRSMAIPDGLMESVRWQALALKYPLAEEAPPSDLAEAPGSGSLKRYCRVRGTVLQTRSAAARLRAADASGRTMLLQDPVAMLGEALAFQRAAREAHRAEERQPRAVARGGRETAAGVLTTEQSAARGAEGSVGEGGAAGVGEGGPVRAIAGEPK